MKAQLFAFHEKIYEANSIRNLTRVTSEDFWIRHFLDSLLFVDLFPIGARVLDIGTGPGFPAWPLAWARPDLKVTAIDSSGKMLDFLRSCPLENLEVVQTRAEEWKTEELFDVVTGRALAPLSTQLELSVNLCEINGVVIPMRSASDLGEIQRLKKNPFGLELERVEEQTLPILEAERLFPLFRKTSPTPKRFPRSWAEMKRKPY